MSPKETTQTQAQDPETGRSNTSQLFAQQHAESSFNNTELNQDPPEAEVQTVIRAHLHWLIGCSYYIRTERDKTALSMPLK